MRITLAVLTLALAALASPSSADVPDPVDTHCVADETGAAHCSTTVAGTCTVSSVGGAPSSLSCDLPEDSRSASADPAVEEPCQSGFAQTWCDFTVGPCDLRVTPWTAWGDQSVVADCAGGGAGPRCHTEVHTQDPTNPEHWCAF